MTRSLAVDPDRVIEAVAAQCPRCAAALAEADQADIHAYDHIDLPPIKPINTRINLLLGGAPQLRDYRQSEDRGPLDGRWVRCCHSEPIAAR